MKIWMAAPCALAMVASSACGVMVVDGVGGGGDTGTTSTGTSMGTGMTDTPNALVIRYGDLPAGVPFDTSPLNGAVPASDALLIVFSNQPLSCANPVPGFSIPPDPCDGNDLWTMEALIPPDLARDGMIDLEDTRIVENAAEASAGCNGGGIRSTPGGSGTLDILGGGPPTLSVKLAGGVYAMETVIDGSYGAVWCGSPPPAAAPTPAVAVLGANLPSSASISPTVGASPDPTATYVFAGTAPQTCTAPVATSQCASTDQITFRIAAGTTPGTYDLADPTLGAWYVSGCPGEGQPFPSGQGSITILSADATSVSFSIYGSYVSSGLDFDDLYAAPVCAP